MKLKQSIKKLIAISALAVASITAPIVATACTPYPSPWACSPGPWNNWRHHHWHHGNGNAALGLLAVGAVAGVIIGAVASQNQRHHRCWVEIRHHHRYRVCN